MNFITTNTNTSSVAKSFFWGNLDAFIVVLLFMLIFLLLPNLYSVDPIIVLFLLL